MLLPQLLTAHLLGDYLFQTIGSQAGRHRLPYMVLHRSRRDPARAGRTHETGRPACGGEVEVVDGASLVPGTLHEGASRRSGNLTPFSFPITWRPFPSSRPRIASHWGRVQRAPIASRSPSTTSATGRTRSPRSSTPSSSSSTLLDALQRFTSAVECLALGCERALRADAQQDPSPIPARSPPRSRRRA